MNYGLNLIPDFVTQTEESSIMSHIGRRGRTNSILRNSIHRYGSSVPYKGQIISDTVPQYLDIISNKIFALGNLEKKPDSVSINEYFIGQAIAPHIDTPTSGEVISILSLVGHAIMTFTPTIPDRELFSVELPPRSLVQMSGEIRHQWKHSIEPVKETRYSIVFRCSKVS